MLPWKLVGNQKSPIRLDRGLGFSQTRFAGTNSPLRSLRMLHAVGISRMTDFTASDFQACQSRIDADSENGCDLRERISLNFFQEKYVPVSLRKFEGSQDRALECARDSQAQAQVSGLAASRALARNLEFHDWISSSRGIVPTPGISFHDHTNDSTFLRLGAKLADTYSTCGAGSWNCNPLTNPM